MCACACIKKVRKESELYHFGNFHLNTEAYLRQRNKVDFKEFTEMCSAGDIS